MKKFFPLFFVIIFMIIIFCFSAMPSDVSNGGSKMIIGNILSLFNISYDNNTINYLNYPFRKFIHFSVYFILGILVFLLLRKLGIRKIYLFTFLICFIFSSTDELHQLFVDGRDGNVFDIFIDMCGTISFIFINYLYNKFRI